MHGGILIVFLDYIFIFNPVLLDSNKVILQRNGNFLHT